MRSKQRQAHRTLKLWSRRDFAALDGRLIEAREEQAIIAALTGQIGKPSAAERILIKRTARAVLMAEVLEKRVIEDGKAGDLESRQLLALLNSVRLCLVALGLKAPEVQPTTVAHFVAANKIRTAA